MTNINLEKLYERREDAKKTDDKVRELREVVKEVDWKIDDGGFDINGSEKASLQIILSSSTGSGDGGFNPNVNTLFRSTTQGELVKLATDFAGKFAINFSLDDIRISIDGCVEATEIVIDAEVHIWY